jgi:hypothetical protein
MGAVLVVVFGCHLHASWCRPVICTCLQTASTHVSRKIQHIAMAERLGAEDSQTGQPDQRLDDGSDGK